VLRALQYKQGNWISMVLSVNLEAERYKEIRRKEKICPM
jgi:hypothetical protein